MQVRSLLVIAQGMEGRADYVLKVRLPRVDDRVSDRGPPERWGVGSRQSAVGSAPSLMTVGIGIERLVAEVFAQQAELPQVISDVLAHVRDRAVRAHDDLDVLAFVLELVGRARVPKPSNLRRDRCRRVRRFAFRA